MIYLFSASTALRVFIIILSRYITILSPILSFVVLYIRMQPNLVPRLPPPTGNECTKMEGAWCLRSREQGARSFPVGGGRLETTLVLAYSRCHTEYLGGGGSLYPDDQFYLDPVWWLSLSHSGKSSRDWTRPLMCVSLDQDTCSALPRLLLLS